MKSPQVTLQESDGSIAKSPELSTNQVSVSLTVEDIDKEGTNSQESCENSQRSSKKPCIVAALSLLACIMIVIMAAIMFTFIFAFIRFIYIMAMAVIYIVILIVVVPFMAILMPFDALSEMKNMTIFFNNTISM